MLVSAAHQSESAMHTRIPLFSGFPTHLGHHSTLSPGEGNGSPLQYSCLENPVDGGAWWAAI